MERLSAEALICGKPVELRYSNPVAHAARTRQKA
jgi:hypothetical protein